MLWLLPSALAGDAWLVQDSFPVHTKAALTLTWSGEVPLRPGDLLVVQEPILHGMRWAKSGYLQTSPQACTPLSEDGDQASVGLVRASAGEAELALTHSVNGPGIHELGEITVEVLSGEVHELSLELGVTEGDCGWQTPDRAMEQVQLRVFEDFDGEETELEPLTLSFEPEEEVASKVVFAPSQALAGEQVLVRVVPLDRWGNVARDRRVREEAISFPDAGVFRVELEGQLSNPVRVTAEPRSRQVYWGDLHTHHGHSWWTEEGDWHDANHAYGRDVMGLDFGCESVKASDHELESAELWERVQRSCEAYTQVDDYVALLGFEWMGGSFEGHHNVYYETCSGPLGDMEWETVSEDLFPFLMEQRDAGQLVLTIPHAPSFTGYNWTAGDDELRPVAEVYSEWGNSMEAPRKGSVPEGLTLGQRLGFVASSDNHDGWLGNGLAEKNSPGGLAAIVATELSSTGLLTALHERSSYATTGARMLLEVRVEEDGQVHRMGEAWSSRGASLSWEAHGTATIESVRLMASRVGAPQQNAFELGVWSPGKLDAQGQAWLPYGPEPLAVWIELAQTDGELGWTSPVFLDREPAPPSRDCRGTDAAWLLLLLPLLARRRRSR